jgi:signal transduction histidine kinase
MRVHRRLRGSLREHPTVVDAALAAAVLAGSLFGHDPEQPAGTPALPPVGVVLVLLTCAAFVGRRRWPVPVLALTTVGAAGVVMIGGRSLVVTATLLALYTVAVNGGRRRTVAAWAATGAILSVASLVYTRASGIGLEALSYVAWSGMAAAVGDALRNRGAYVDAVEERAVRAERTREEEARRQVVEERLRIARELHDVVAHRIAVVNVQAGVAAHLLRSQPEAAEEALRHVREAGRAVLDEVAEILTVLRQPGESPEPTAPAPSIAQLDELVSSFSSAGLAVDWSLRGQPIDVGSSVGLVAYRVLQEALTNAHKHGTGTAHVLVTYAPSALTLAVDNPVREWPARQPAGVEPQDSSHGLVGMRERAAAVGGMLTAAPAPDGSFRVEALLPVPSSPAA